MKKIVYTIYILWAVVSIALKITIGGFTWCAALAWLWLPIVMMLIALLGMFLFTDLGMMLKKRKEVDIPHTCETCLYGYASKYDNEGKCLGEQLDEAVKKGECCQYYKQHLGI